MSGPIKTAILSAALIVTGCAKRVPAPAAAVPQPTTEDRVLYERGLAAFRESTPEGYARAAGLFHRASMLVPNNCDYALNFAQASLFQALEQEVNLDDFKTALDSSATPACGVNTAFGQRLEAFRALPEFQLKKNRDAAVTLMDQASRSDPDDPLNWYVSWKLSSGQRESLQLYEGIKASETDPHLALTYYELGSFWLLRNRHAEARRAFEHAIEANPRHFRSYIGLAQAVSEMDDAQDVEPLYRKAVELAPDFLEGRIILGDYLVWSGQNELATGQYLAAIEHNPRFETAYLGLASNDLDMEKLDDAEKASAKAIELNPRSYKAFYYLGNVWYERHDLNKAEEYFRESVNIGRYSDAIYALGTVLWEKNEVDAALTQFDKVLDFNSFHAAALLSRAIIRSERLQFREALLDSAQALKLYDRELEDITKTIENATKRGLFRRVDAQRKKKDRIDTNRKRAQEVKAAAETHLN
jgi:tetratricopeptide (TPR) repeat protein